MVDGTRPQRKSLGSNPRAGTQTYRLGLLRNECSAGSWTVGFVRNVRQNTYPDSSFRTNQKQWIHSEHASTDLEYVEVNGIRVTPLVRTVFDCCRRYPVRKCLGVADSALRLLQQDSSRLKEQFRAFPRQSKGRKQANIIASMANPLSENGGESLARATMIMLGYQTPQLQVEKSDPVDGSTYRLDFLWMLPNGTEIAGELDGHEKYVNPKMTYGKPAEDILIDERLRESRINALGIPVARFSMKDVSNPSRFARILDAFGIPRIERRIKPDTSLPLNWQLLRLDEWLIEYEVIQAAA